MLKDVNNNIMTTLGIDKLPEEKQQEIMGSLGAVVYQEVIARALDVLTEKDKDEFEKIVESNPNPETLLDFLEMKVPNFSGMVAEEAKKLKNESEEIMSKIGE